MAGRQIFWIRFNQQTAVTQALRDLLPKPFRSRLLFAVILILFDQISSRLPLIPGCGIYCMSMLAQGMQTIV